MHSERLSLLRKFLSHEENLDSLQTQLSKFPWDFKGEPLVLNRKAVSETLHRYINGILEDQDVYAWADFLELRDDVQCAQEDEFLLSEIMHELANPDTEGKLTPKRATFLLEKLLS